MGARKINADHAPVTGVYPEVTGPDCPLDLFDALGVPSPDMARRLVRMLNLSSVVERRLAGERSDAA